MTFWRLLRGVARRVIQPMSTHDLATRLVERKCGEDPSLQPYLDRYTLENAREHFADQKLAERHHQEVNRYFHARLAQILTDRLAGELKNVSILDVGDSDGLLLKDLGKSGVGFNNSQIACAQIRPCALKLWSTRPLRTSCWRSSQGWRGGRSISRSPVCAKRSFTTASGGSGGATRHRVLRAGFQSVLDPHIASRVLLRAYPYLRLSERDSRTGELLDSTRHLLAGCFKFFQFYELEPTHEDLGLDQAAYQAPYA